MESKHLQSMIAINANRITEKHNRIASALLEAKQFKLVNQITRPGPYSVYVDMMAKKAYAIADKTRLELKKSVEMQKALQAELRANRAAEKAAKPIVKSRFFVQADGSTWGDGTVCVETTGKGTYICYDKYSNAKVIEQAEFWGDAEWAASRDFIKEVDGVPNMKASDVQAPGEYNIARDGQPKKNGEYLVRYTPRDTLSSSRYFEDGVWYTCKGGGEVGFGNFEEDFESESYIVG